MKTKNVFLKVGLYYFIAFLFSGIFFAIQNYFEISGDLFQLPMYGPTIGAIIMILLEKDKLGKFFKEIFSFKGDLMCYLSILIPIFIVIPLSYYARVYLNSQCSLDITFNTTLLIIIIHRLTDATGEEIGWRGYMLPTLQKKFTPLVSSLILGVLWAIWHVPKMMLGMEIFLISLIYIVSFSVIITVYYNRASKSIVPAALMHFVANLVGNLFLICMDNITILWLFTLLYVIWAVILIILNWKALIDTSRIQIENPIL
jgi:membrane protease YdiL (CAAX protease family)